MNTSDELDIKYNEHMIKEIKNISTKLNEIKSFYQKDNLSDIELNNSQELQNIQTSIKKVVENIDKEQVEEFSVYQSIQNVKDNDTLIISEKADKVFLPYTVQELNEYLEEYPDEYKSLSDVINQEYIVPLDRFKNHTTARFRETYCLMRDIEMKSIIESFRKAVEFMFNSKLNPAIISACKSEEQLNNYRYCAERGNWDEFKDFKIVFDVAPLDDNKYQSDYADLFLKFAQKKTKGKHY